MFISSHYELQSDRNNKSGAKLSTDKEPISSNQNEEKINAYS